MMLCIVAPMYSKRLKAKMNFERRFNMHWLFLPMTIILFFHAQRTFYIMFAFSCFWLLDFLHNFLHHTHRLDFVEFTRLRDGGVQVLWHNPPGFQPHAGEFTKHSLLHAHSPKGGVG
jgi:hypothetical protein